ncbi:MAG: Rrf2 family transcriptional regulator [Planctomycetaceae bacterium]|nr:Rrf2 family transcriptional regulator [Planctomycetaceae bacterium]
MAGLLNIGEMGALALHVMVELAMLREEDPDARRTVQEIAAGLHASVHTLQKVTRRLVAMGLVEGTRGANGGLRLEAEPENVTMLDVIEGIEGKLGCNGCMFARRVCPDGACRFSGITGELEKKVHEYFAATTIAGLAKKAAHPQL